MPSDTELLTRWRAGEREAGTRLFEGYYEDVERFFINKANDSSTEIRDLVQETFTALVQNRDKVEDPARFRSYVFGVAYKVFQSHLRKKYRRGERGPRAGELDELSVHELSPSPSAVLYEKREQRLLLEGLRRIPVADQTLLELFYWEELSTADIGAIIGIPRGTVKTRLRSARERLEAAMSRIAESAEVLASTLSDLDAWAEKCRGLLSRGR